MKLPKYASAHHLKRGFALVVTLSLMILLTAIAVGLLSLAGITLRSSAGGGAAATARANARLALMIALGELQKELGPDSRISAPHDAGTDAKGGQPHWTAVYDAWESKPGTAAVPETPASRNVKFRGWLVSGANQSAGGSAGTTALLVGSRGLGAGATAADEVRAPTQAVSVGTQRGRIAWWTADEAAKAKVNAGPDATPKNSFGVSDPLFAAQSAPNIGHQVGRGRETNSTPLTLVSAAAS